MSKHWYDYYDVSDDHKTTIKALEKCFGPLVSIDDVQFDGEKGGTYYFKASSKECKTHLWFTTLRPHKYAPENASWSKHVVFGGLKVDDVKTSSTKPKWWTEKETVKRDPSWLWLWPRSKQDYVDELNAVYGPVLTLCITGQDKNAMRGCVTTAKHPKGIHVLFTDTDGCPELEVRKINTFCKSWESIFVSKSSCNNGLVK